jgi:tetratricopeptide (TPR) repeat protein
LTAKFRRFGMHRYVARCTFVDGIAHKDLGRLEEALEKLRLVGEFHELEVEDWLRGLALSYAADILATQGQDSAASKTLAEAWALLKDSGVPTAIAHFHGVKGEILRDRGQLELAIDSYRLAVSSYEGAHLRAQEVMLRLILAETLLAAGRDDDAIEQIVTALPVIETLGLIREGVVAVALLRESLSRQEVNPEALRTLKRELQELNRGRRS